MPVPLWKRTLARTLIAVPLTVGLGGCDDEAIEDAGDSGGGNANEDAGGSGADDKDAGNGADDDAGSVDKEDAGDVDNDAGAVPEGDTYGITSAGRLVFFERGSGAVQSAVALSGLGSGETVLGADVRPADGALYALSSAGKLYTVDLATGAAALKSTLAADAGDATSPFSALSGAKFGVDFNPVADRLRIVSNDGQNLRVNVDTGATNTDGALGPSTPDITAAGYSNSFSAACRTRLYVVDSTDKSLLLQDPPNDGKLSLLGALGVSAFDEVAGFEVTTTSDGSNLGTLAVSSAVGVQLLDVDLATGLASKARALALNAGETLLGIATLPPTTAPAQAAGELLGLTVENRLISFNRGAPGKLCTTVAISGLGAGEKALGIDMRPADGALYALGSTGKLYTLDVVSGAASLKSTLAADAADVSDAFTALSGDDFALGFNPVPDRLRVMSNNGQNLRINVDTGATTTDSVLSPGTPVVTAAAYTNSFSGAKSTTLYAIDSGSDSLVLVGANPATGGACPASTGNPNCGVLTSVGVLGTADVSGVNGFDIDGKTGAALAALVVGAATSSTLYSIDLSSGAASLPAGVANGTIGGGQPLRGLTLAAKLTLSAFALTSDNHLLVLSPSAPNTPSADLAISGLTANEKMLGIDVRPLDGKLYALGSSSRLYTIDTTTGAATELSALQAASGDDNPFTALADAGHGLDFNPAADLLRVVDADAANLRIAPSARNTLALGDTVTDVDLNGATPDVMGAAYTNAFAGTTSTTLYVIDSSTDTLYLQGGLSSSPSPNTGTLTSVGALGIDVAGDIGFDVTGGHNGLAMAAILRADGTQSELYSIALGAGTATAFNAASNTIGSSSAMQVIGLALELK